MRLSAILLAFTACFWAWGKVPQPASVSALPAIQWTEWFNPPVFIHKGKYTDQGFSDKIQQHIFNKLPQYKHETLKANIPRVIKLAEEKSNTCNSSWLDTPEWRKIFYFSKPYFLVPTNGIIIRKAHHEKFNKVRSVSLDKLLTEKKMKLGLSRMYGEGIDDVLKKHKYQKNPLIKVVKKSIQPHQLLMRNRVDYILGYPFEMVFHQKTMPGYDGYYLFTDENSDTIPVVFACSKTSKGKAIIEQIDKILKDPKVHQLYQGYLNEWLTPSTIKGMRKDYRKFVRKYYR